MSIKQPTHSTTNIGIPELKMLNNQASKVGVKNIQYLNAAMLYFKKTGVNPLEPELSPKDEIVKLQKRNEEIIKFIRVFENDRMIPLLERLIILERRITGNLNDLPSKSAIAGEMQIILHQTKELERVTNLYYGKIRELMDKFSLYFNHFEFNQTKTQNMLVCLFQALQNKGMSSFKDADIKNFTDACNQVRSNK